MNRKPPGTHKTSPLLRARIARWKRRNPEKARAHQLLFQAIQRGEILRGPCSVCGTSEDVHGHHADYAKPLEVVWMCRSCHVTHQAATVPPPKIVTDMRRMWHSTPDAPSLNELRLWWLTCQNHASTSPRSGLARAFAEFRASLDR